MRVYDQAEKMSAAERAAAINRPQREAQERTLVHALVMRLATDDQKFREAEYDLGAELSTLSSIALFELQRALDLVQTKVAQELRGRP